MKAILFLLVCVCNELYPSSKLLLALELAKALPQHSKSSKSAVENLLPLKPGRNGVIDVSVLQQGFRSGWPTGRLGDLGLTWDDIDADDGANCGYHALKNTLFFMNAIGKRDEKYLKFLTSKQPYFDCMGVWASMIYERRGYSTPINWLGGEEIDDLVHHLSRLSVIPEFSDLDVNVKIVVTEDVRNVGAAVGLPINETMLQDIRNLAAQKNGMLGVVWTAGRGGHWVSFVLYKRQGTLKVYYMNSCNGCLPRFAQAINLFSMSTRQIDDLIGQNQKDKINTDLDSMQSDLSVLLGNVQEEIVIYPHYVGCVKRHTAMNEPFERQNLLHAGFSLEEVDDYVDVVNNEWAFYLQEKIDRATFQDNYLAMISTPKERIYGFWIDKQDQTAFVLDLDVKDCAAAQKYRGVMLLLDKQFQTSFFDPVDKLHAIFTQILVGWKNMPQSLFDKNIQAQIQDILKRVLTYYKDHPAVFITMDWGILGSESNSRPLSGFDAVIKAVLDRLTLLSAADRQKFKKEFVDPLLTL